MCREEEEEGEGEEEGKEEDDDDDFVRIEPDMHRGHVEVRVLKEGWLQKQSFRVVDGRPTIWRHFAFWKLRYFVLGSDGVLRYYKDKELQKFRRAIPLAGMEVTDHFYAPVDHDQIMEGGKEEGEGGLMSSVTMMAAAVGSAEDRMAEKGGRCLIVRPKQMPHPLTRRRAGSSGGQSQQQKELLLKEEEEMKLLAPSKEDMQEWLAALRGEVEATERQGQTLFHTAWSLLRSYVDRPHAEEEWEDGGEQGGRVESERSNSSDFVHVEGEDDQTSPPPSHAPSCRQGQSSSTSIGGTTAAAAAAAADVSFVPPSVPIPRMNVVMMVVGTRGDVQPFLALGQLLRAHGHRVRLATHAMYRPLVVEEAGLEFYPLGGDPLKLSAYMVKTSGRIFPFKLPDHEEMIKDVPEQRAMLSEIILSTWPACSAADPDDSLKREFRADAIISNPPVYGHVHCAEALNVPLHIMFPQPWSPTKAFPHPLSGLPYHGHWCKENYYSYLVVDKFLWLGIQDIVNELRVARLGLSPLRLGEHGGDLLNRHRVPFAKMWSPCLVPKPKDWGPHIDVVGHFFGPQTTGTPPGAEALEAWLRPAAPGLPPPEPPIFVGFGSMVISDARSLVAMILEAARLTGTRVILQSSWTELPVPSSTSSSFTPSSSSSSDVFSIGNCPHDWLLKRCCAVIHHGGAGTVAAGLRAGKPTMVCPFFGDQFFWGQMVHQAHVGVRPIPVVQLTAEKLAAAFQELRSPSLVAAAEMLAQRLAREDGAKEGLRAFYRHLPVEDMVCDVSLFMGKPLLARIFCSTCGLKMSAEAHAAVHECSSEEGREEGEEGVLLSEHHDVHGYSAMDWASMLGPKDATEGLVQGLTSLTHECLGSMAGVVTEPVVGAQKTGMRGAARGLASGLANLIRRPIRGGFIFVDKVTAGVSNQLHLQQHGGGKSLSSSPSSVLSSSSSTSPPSTTSWPGGEKREGGRGGSGGGKEGGVVLSPELVAELKAAQVQALRCKKMFLRLSKGDPRCVPKEGVLRLLEDMGGGVKSRSGSSSSSSSSSSSGSSGGFSGGSSGIGASLSFHLEQQQQQLQETRVLSKALLDRIDAVGAGHISFQQFCVLFKALRQGGLLQQQQAERRGSEGGDEGAASLMATTVAATEMAVAAATATATATATAGLGKVVGEAAAVVPAVDIAIAPMVTMVVRAGAEQSNSRSSSSSSSSSSNSNKSSKNTVLDSLIFDTIFLDKTPPGPTSPASLSPLTSPSLPSFASTTCIHAAAEAVAEGRRGEGEEGPESGKDQEHEGEDGCDSGEKADEDTRSHVSSSSTSSSESMEDIEIQVELPAASENTTSQGRRGGGGGEEARKGNVQGEEKRSVVEERDEDKEEKHVANARAAALFAVVERG